MNSGYLGISPFEETPRHYRGKPWYGIICDHYFDDYSYKISRHLIDFHALETFRSSRIADVELGRIGDRLIVRKRYHKHRLLLQDGLALKRELLAHLMLDHPNIPRIESIYENENIVDFYIKYYPKGDLLELLDSATVLSQEMITRIFLGVLAAVTYMHTQRVYHRDIKPENILLDQDYQVHLTDFGLCAIGSGRELYSSVGSHYYVAPEILNGRFYSGTQVDCWSLGCLLYALIHRKLPYATTDPDEMLGLPEIDPKCPPEFRKIIRGLLCYHPPDRMTIPECYANLTWNLPVSKSENSVRTSDGGDSGRRQSLEASDSEDHGNSDLKRSGIRSFMGRIFSRDPV